MLPVLAVVFAVVGAVAGSFAPPITQGYYKIGSNCSQQPGTLNRTDCRTDLDDFKPACTVLVAGSPTAYSAPGCAIVLRYNP